MSKVCLHIGASKTGSSFLQSHFVLNRDLLLQHNYLYPAASNDTDALKLKISSGNGIKLGMLLKNKNTTYRELKKYISKQIKLAKGQNLLISSEVMESYLAENMVLLQAIVKKMGYQVIIVYYIRAIGDHHMSSYHQLLKRNSFKGDFAATIKKKSNRSLTVIEKSIAVLGKENIVIKNYDNVKNNIFEDFLENILHIQGHEEFKILNQKVNRSLTDFEVNFMRKINKFFTEPKHSTFISNALIHGTPNLQYQMTINQNEVNALMKMYENDIDQIDKYLPEEERPITLIKNLKIINEEKPVQLNPFQSSVLAILAELTKEIRK